MDSSKNKTIAIIDYKLELNSVKNCLKMNFNYSL